MPGEDQILSDANRQKLDGIVKQMTTNSESDDTINAVVNDFKTKYSEKKKELSNQFASASPLVLANGSSVSENTGSAPLGINYLTGQQNVPQGTNPVAKHDSIELNQGFNLPEVTPVSLTAGRSVPTQPLTAATTPIESTAKDQNNYNPEFQKELKSNEITESFMRGTARLGSSLLKSPGFVYDVLASSQGELVKKGLDKLHMGSSQQISDATGIENTVAQDLDKSVENSQAELQKKYDKPVSEYFEKGDYEKGFGLLANSVVESLPAMIGIAMGNAAGASPLVTTLAGGAVFGADKKSQLDKENPEMDDGTKAANALLTGLFEGVTESLPIAKLGSLTKNIFAKSGEEVAKEFAKKSFIKTYGKVLSRYLGVQGSEMVGEVANQFAENVVDKYSGAKPDIKLTQGLKDAAIISAGTGLAMTTPIAALDVVKTKSALKKASDLSDQKKTLEADLLSPDVSESVKSNISAKIQDINEEEANLAQQEKEKFDALPSENKEQVNSLLDQSHKISSSIVDPTVSEETKEIFKKDLDKVDKEIDKIFEDSEKQKVEKQKQQDTDAEWMKSFEEDIAPPTPIQDAVVANDKSTLSDDQKKIESNLAKDLDENYEERKAEYLKENGNVFDTDRARWLSPEYKKNPALLSSAVHIPAREFVTKVFNEELAKDAPEGKENIVTWTAGGSGVGKSYLVEKAKDDKSQLIVDTNLSNFDNAVTDIEQALSAGKDAHISYMYKDPVKAFKEGVMGGTTRGGRTVPISIAIGSNKGSLETIKKLAEKYKDDPNVKINFFDNNGTKDQIKEVSLDNLKALKVDYKNAEKEIQDEIDRKYDAGELTDDQYQGFTGKSAEETRKHLDARAKRKSSQGTKETLAESGKQQASEKIKQPESKELIDEEEQIEASKDDDEASVKKLNDDIEILKSFKEVDIASKKFKGILDRAFKMKEEGKIKKPTYTRYRNIAQEVLGPKVSLDAEKRKYEIETLKEQVKKKLLGEGYKKVLMSAPGFGPKQVADLIDLTAIAVNKAIDAGYTVKEAVERALKHIKKHPYYSKLIEEGHLKEDEFKKTVTDTFTPAEEKPEPKKETAKTEEKSKSVKEADIHGETRKKKTAARIRNSESYKDVAAEMDKDEDFYASIDVKKATQYIDEQLDKFESENMLEDLADKIIENKNPFHPKIQNLASAKLADKIRLIAQKEGNEFQKDSLNKLAAKILVAKNRNTNIAATQTALEAKVAKLMPVSEEALKEFAAASLSDVQNTYLSEQQQKEIQSAVTDINKILESEEAQRAIKEAVESEIDRIAEATKGKEWTSKVNDAIESLKIDLTDC